MVDRITEGTGDIKIAEERERMGIRLDYYVGIFHVEHLLGWVWVNNGRQIFRVIT
jgi:hypothetical protein